MDEQTAKNQKENSTRKSLNKQDSLVLKIVLIAFLILLSFIPMSMIRGLINEREMTANAAAQEVQQKWSKSQTLIGPILTIPYFYQNEKGENQKGYINYLPEQLNITGDVNTQELKRGLYEIIVYNSTLEITGTFSAKDLKESNLFPYDKWIETATINLGISDLRGINEQISLEWDNRKLNFTPGVDPHSLVVSGISSKITPQQLFTNDSIVHFMIKLKLKAPNPFNLPLLAEQQKSPFVQIVKPQASMEPFYPLNERSRQKVLRANGKYWNSTGTIHRFSKRVPIVPPRTNTGT